MRVCLVLAPLALLLGTGCDEGGGPGFEATTSTTTTKGSGGGFSADLAKSLGSGSGGGSAAAGSGSAAAGSGSATATAGSGSGSAAQTASNAGSGSATAGSGSGSATATASNAGSGSATPAAAGSATPTAAGSATPTNAGSGSASTASVPKPRVTPPAELAAIKLSLSPNWDRDAGEAGTISLAVKIPGTDQIRTFSFRYGVEDPKAPSDRDAYKKWLADNKILDAKIDRQRGAAWYLEGTDGAGAPTFRIVVQYGGKKLICGGSLYRDAASSQLGDIRDKTIIQAKEICETLAL